MSLQKELNKKTEELRELIKSKIKDGIFCVDKSDDGSYTLKVSELKTEIGQLQDKILDEK